MTTTLEVAAQQNLETARTAYATALDDVECRSVGKSLSEIDQLERDVNLQQLEDNFRSAERRAKHAASATEARSASAHLIPNGDVRVLSEPTTYQKDNPWGPSFFSDLYKYQRNGDRGALERLERGTKETLVLAEERKLAPYRDAEGRAMSSTTGAGGDFLPPLYFGDLYAEFKRAKRVTASLVRNLPLAAVGNTVTVPKFTGGTLTGAQQDNANVTTQDATTSIITIPVCTVAGYNDASRQIIERSEPGLDQLLAQDLLSDYDKRVNSYVLNGTGSSGQPKGILQTSYNAVTFTNGSPTVGLLYPKLLDSIRQINENVFEPATAFVMTARRWAWILDALDSSGRPLVVPSANGPYSSVGVLSSGTAGPFGNDSDTIAPAGTLLGLPVFIDETLPKTQGTGTNQDVILSAAFKEHILWEDANGPRQFRFDGVASQTASIRVQVFGYAAFTAERFPTATSVVAGSGLAAPSF